MISQHAIIGHERIPAGTRIFTRLNLHWNCSGFSADFSMRRTSTILIFVALLLGTATYGASAESGRSRKGATPATASHKKAAPAAMKHRGQTPKTPAKKESVPTHARTAHESRALATASRRGNRRALLHSRLATVALGSTVAGSHDSLVRQNEKVVADGLERFENDNDLHDHIANKDLVPVPTSDDLTVNPSLPEDRRYCRPWTAEFLADLARAHADVFHHAVLVSSAVRTVVFQKRLRHHNRNAAPAEGDVASPHLTGAAVDIAKSPLSNEEKEWMRGYLLTLQNAGKIDVEEEFREACFHITVYKSYDELVPDDDDIAKPLVIDEAGEPGQ